MDACARPGRQPGSWLSRTSRTRDGAERRRNVLVEQGAELFELAMPLADVSDIAERARNFRQIPGFAVAMPQSREDADGLEVALHAHQVEPAQELRVVAA